MTEDMTTDFICSRCNESFSINDMYKGDLLDDTYCMDCGESVIENMYEYHMDIINDMD